MQRPRESATDPVQARTLTLHLQQWRSSRDPSAYNAVAELAHQELRRIAAAYMHRERVGHTLQPTALINECHIKLLGEGPVDWRNRAHFFAIAARRMRQILVDYARQHKAKKRGAEYEHVELLEAVDVYEELDLEAVHDALIDLERLNEGLAQLIECRFFGGLTHAECAEVLGLSAKEVAKQGRFAKAWLQKTLTDKDTSAHRGGQGR
ncbi:MAG: sigma-70 family RNA polymerase sigma factor [bacterium]|nr:sigma-70 family RNA polymerase sigma factor [bacterium]